MLFVRVRTLVSWTHPVYEAHINRKWLVGLDIGRLTTNHYATHAVSPLVALQKKSWICVLFGSGEYAIICEKYCSPFAWSSLFRLRDSYLGPINSHSLTLLKPPVNLLKALLSMLIKTSFEWQQLANEDRSFSRTGWERVSVPD